MEAMRLWERFRYYRDEASLKALLDYNRDDIVNLHHLENRLAAVPLSSSPAKRSTRKEGKP
jgi:uncharacterized protein YprB with RNaseH-like and TPR domain